jgi:hypothetical protein
MSDLPDFEGTKWRYVGQRHVYLLTPQVGISYFAELPEIGGDDTESEIRVVLNLMRDKAFMLFLGGFDMSYVTGGSGAQLENNELKLTDNAIAMYSDYHIYVNQTGKKVDYPVWIFYYVEPKHPSLEQLVQMRKVLQMLVKRLQKPVLFSSTIKGLELD